MKRLLSLLLLLSLIACGGETEPEASGPDNILAIPTNTPEVALPPPAIEGETEPEAPAVAPETVTEAEPVVVEDALPSGPITAWPSDKFGYGVQIHGNATVGDPKHTMDVVQNQLGVQWVKMQIQWWLVHPEPKKGQWFFYDGVIEEAARHDVKLMVSVVGAPEWTRALGGENGPPDDYKEYANFLTELLTRHQGRIHAVEVWNEQNLDREWTAEGGLNAADYTQFLAVAYEAIKAVDPNIIVISGALAPTGGWTEADGRVTAIDDFIYLDELIANDFLSYTDCVGAHHNGYNIPPNLGFDETGTFEEAQTAVFRGPYDNPHHSWSFKTTLDVYADKVQAVDPSMKLCVTEFGWASVEGYTEFPEGFQFAEDNTLEEQAEFIVLAYQQMRTSGDVLLTFLFNFDFGNKGSGPTDDTVPYSILDSNGVPRPAFEALADMEKLP